jgi:hypothetical protein
VLVPEAPPGNTIDHKTDKFGVAGIGSAGISFVQVGYVCKKGGFRRIVCLLQTTAGKYYKMVTGISVTDFSFQ